MTTYKEMLMSADAFRELRNRIQRELAAHPETSGGKIICIDIDPDTGDLLITAQYTGGQRVTRIVLKDEGPGPYASQEEIEARLDEAKSTMSVEDKVPFQVYVVYRVNGGALRTAQRTVQACDDREAVDLAQAQLTATFANHRVTFGQANVRAVADGGAV